MNKLNKLNLLTGNFVAISGYQTKRLGSAGDVSVTSRFLFGKITAESAVEYFVASVS